MPILIDYFEDKNNEADYFTWHPLKKALHIEIKLCNDMLFNTLHSFVKFLRKA